MAFILGSVAEGMEGFPFFSGLISWSLLSLSRGLIFRTENFSFRKHVIFLDDKPYVILPTRDEMLTSQGEGFFVRKFMDRFCQYSSRNINFKINVIEQNKHNFFFKIKSYKLILGDQIYCPRGLRRGSATPLPCWDCGFETHQVVNVCLCKCCMLSGRFLCDKIVVQRRVTDCGASLCVILKPQKCWDHGPRWAAASQETKTNPFLCPSVYRTIITAGRRMTKCEVLKLKHVFQNKMCCGEYRNIFSYWQVKGHKNAGLIKINKFVKYLICLYLNFMRFLH